MLLRDKPDTADAPPREKTCCEHAQFGKETLSFTIFWPFFSTYNYLISIRIFRRQGANLTKGSTFYQAVNTMR